MANGHTERVLTLLRQIRSDGWQNTMTRLGTALDRATHTTFVPTKLPSSTLSALFHGDDTARLICSIYVEEALRLGWGKVPELDRLNALQKIQEAAIWGQVFGGGVIVIGAEDGQDPRMPLRLPLVQPIRWLDVYDRRRVERSQGLTGSLEDAEIFRVTPLYGATFEIHRSRCLTFGGALTASEEKERNAGWDDSILQVVYDTIRQFNDAHLALGNMLTDASQSVIKMRGLIAAMAGGQKEDIETRAQLISLTRSVARAVLLDAGDGAGGGAEDYSKIATSFSGVPEAIDRLANRLAAATRIPVTILMGQAPAGLNATGETDLRSWYDRVQSFREQKIDPQVRRLFEIAGLDCEPSWPSLWQETDAEQTSRQKTDAEIDSIYFDLGVVTADKIAARVKSRYPGLEIAPPVPALPAPTPAPDVPTGDDEAATQDGEPARFAEKMTAAGVAACEHGCTNRCPRCGIERLRGFEMVDGKPVWRVAWRAIPK